MKESVKNPEVRVLNRQDLISEISELRGYIDKVLLDLIYLPKVRQKTIQHIQTIKLRAKALPTVYMKQFDFPESPENEGG